MTAPSARAAKTGVALEGPRGMAASRRAMRARDLGPGTSVRSWMVFIGSSLLIAVRLRRRTLQKLVPGDGGFVEIDEDLFGFEILFETPGAEFAAKAGLLVTAPGRFDVSWLHVIDPDDARAERFHDAEGFVDIAGPDGGGETVRRVVGDANGFGFTVERDDRSDGAEDFFASDARRVFHVVENSRLHIVAFAKLLRAAAANGDFRFLLADVEVGTYAVVLFFADQRAHLGVAFERSAEFDALGLFGHGFDKLGVDLLLDKDAAACRANFALIDKDAKERAVHGGFPVCIGEENVGGFAAEFERDALEGVGGALDDDFADVWMRDDGGAGGFAKTIDDVDHAGWQACFFKPVGKFERGERSLFGRLEHAGATGGDGGTEFPGSHEQRIVPGNDLPRDADRFAHGEAQSVGGNGIHVAGDFIGEAAVVLETGGDVGHVEFGFDNGLAGVAALEFAQRRGVLADFFGKLEEDATAVLGSSGGPGAGIERGARGFDGL